MIDMTHDFNEMSMKIIYSKFDKSQINALPRALFQGRIVVVVSANEARKAVDYLLTQPILGIDTETRPSFKKGIVHNVALLQVACKDICFLFRLNLLRDTIDIVRLLEDKKIPKVGISLHDDILMLHKLMSFTPGNFIDLQEHVGEIGIEDKSLQKLYANIFRQKISKGQRLTNWEADVLNDNQKLYAATDAWACIKLYDELQHLKNEKNFKLIKIEQDE